MRRKSLFVIVILLGIIAGCAGPQPAPSGLTAEQQFLLTAEQTYLSQLNDTIAMSNMTNLSEAQKDVVRLKKKILTQLKPLLDIYRNTVRTGGVPSQQSQQQIMDLLNQLTSVVTQ